MPTPDASQFTQFQRIRPVQDQVRTDNKTITHLYRPIITTAGTSDFLTSFSNKKVSPLTRFVKYTIPRLAGGTVPGGSGVAGNGSRNVTPVKPKYIQ
jgi:hypothetical protein